jgi:hypothetical protein
MSLLTTKTQSLNPRPHEAQLEDLKPMKSSRRSSRRGEKPHAQQNARKAANQAKMERRAKKSLKTQKAHKTQKLPLNNLPLTLSMQALPLR